MRFFSARLLALATLVPALVLFVVVPGCAKQSEGERCGDASIGPDNEDCGDGLTCTNYTGLLNADGAHRCCRTDGQVTDSRCEPKGPGSVPSGGSGGGGGSGTAGGTDSGVAGDSSEAPAAGGQGS